MLNEPLAYLEPAGHAALRDRGAVVTGIDSSAKMLELARKRLGDDADLHLADPGSPLPFPDKGLGGDPRGVPARCPVSIDLASG